MTVALPKGDNVTPDESLLSSEGFAGSLVNIRFPMFDIENGNDIIDLLYEVSGLEINTHPFYFFISDADYTAILFAGGLSK